MRSWIPVVLGCLVVAAVVLAPVGYRSVTSVRYRNFHVVDAGRLYRSGQMTPAGFSRVVREFDIGTVISLRDTQTGGGEYEDQSEEDYCRAHDVDFRRFPLAGWSPVNGEIPGDRNVADFLRIAGDPKTRFPILVHCFAGIHRTGPLCAAYRMEFQGWSSADAIAEMWGMGTVRTRFDTDLLDYLGSYRLKCHPAAGRVASVGHLATQP